MKILIHRIKEDKKKCIVAVSVLAIILTLLIEIVIFQWDIISLPKEQRIITNVDLSTLENNDFSYQDGMLVGNHDSNTLDIDIDSTYIQKLSIQYQATNNFTTTIRNHEIGTYDQETNVTYISENSFKTHFISRNINAISKGAEIEFQGSSEIKILSISIDNHFSINKYRCLFLLGSMLLMATLWVFRNRYFRKYENAFVLITLVIGMFIILFTPNITSVSQDDETHFKRAYQLLDIGETGWSDTKHQMRSAQPFPLTAVQSKEEFGEQTRYLNANDGDVIYYSTAPGKLSYNMLSYAHSSLVLKIGEVLRLPFSIWFMLGKASNLLFYTIIMYFAIQQMPVKKYLLFFFALLPTNLSLASNYSSDGIITSCIMLGFALFLKQLYSEEKVTAKWTVMYLASMSFGIFAKAVYAPIILLPLLFKKDRFIDDKSRIKFKLGITAVFLAIMATFVLPAILAPSIVGDPRASGFTSMVGQLKIIFGNILDFIKVFINNAGVQFFDKFVGPDSIVQMGYLGNLPSYIYYIIFIVLIFLTAISTRGEKMNILNKKFKIFMFLSAFVMIGLIWTALYLDFTAVGATEIQGVQGRYFLPILLPLLYCCTIPSLKTEITKAQMQNTLYVGCSIILLVAVYVNVLSVFCF